MPVAHRRGTILTLALCFPQQRAASPGLDQQRRAPSPKAGPKAKDKPAPAAVAKLKKEAEKAKTPRVQKPKATAVKGSQVTKTAPKSKLTKSKQRNPYLMEYSSEEDNTVPDSHPQSIDFDASPVPSGGEDNDYDMGSAEM